MKKQELLAPAGDIEAGYAALYYGADAVYLGLAKFSARATAVNFDENSLNEFTAYAHSLQRKVYVALNTVLQECELPELINSLDLCTRCRIDGLIIQDLGVAAVMREKYPWFEMHASTQMAVHNKEGALYLQKLGFKRVVLARELTAEEIKDISSIENLETEAFIHGALCYSYSGLCMFSSIEHGRSANRGKCMYPCRAEFEYNGKKTHLFSMKDMALQGDILNMPVDSLKIEGRKKSALYVAAVTDYYRHILDNKKAEIDKEERIKQIFSRPWCKFHFRGKNKDIIDRDFIGHRGLLIGKIESLKNRRIRFTTNHKVSRFDGLQFDTEGNEKPFGFSTQKIYLGNKSVFEVNAGQCIEVELPEDHPDLKRGDKVYLASSGEVKGSYRYDKPKPREFRNTHDIDVTVTVKSDTIIAQSGRFITEISGNFTPATNPQKSIEAIQNAFSKTGDTEFNLNSLTINNNDNLFTPSSLLNELRRDLYAKIEIEYPRIVLPEIHKRNNIPEHPSFVIKTDNIKYLNLLDLGLFSEIVILINPNTNVSDIRELPKDKVRIALPAVCRKPVLYNNIINELLDNGYCKWEVANYWGMEVLPIEKLDISFDSSIYMLNTQAISMAQKIGVSHITLSLEDTKVNICDIIQKSPIKTQLVIYQDIPLFTSVGCIRDNNCINCKGQRLWFEMKRGSNKYKAISDRCQMMVFNDKPFCIASQAKNIRSDYLRIDFVYRQYTALEVKDIVDKLLNFSDISHCIDANFSNGKL